MAVTYGNGKIKDIAEGRPVVVVPGGVDVQLRPGGRGDGLCRDTPAGLCRACAGDIHCETPQQPIHRDAG